MHVLYHNQLYLTLHDMVGYHPRPCIQERELILPGFLQEDHILLIFLLLLVDQPHLLIILSITFRLLSCLVQGVKCVFPPIIDIKSFR